MKRARSVRLRCRGHMWPALSYPDYRLMAYALDHDDLSLDEINQIAMDQTTACASMLLGESVLMLNASKTAEDYAVALSHGASFARLAYAAPEMFSEMIRITNALPDTIKEDNDFSVGFILEYSLTRDFLQAEIGCKTAYENTLAGAIACANVAAEKIGERPLTAAYAYYYALRAKRLGWEDVANAEKAAQGVLTPDCLAAIATLEEAHTRESLDHRQYLTLNQPYELRRLPACDNLQPDSPD
ncbi:hypothetical protein [Hyphococcus luteus]|nr:hypothetical protein [Marinicaulis flavus]